MFVARLALAVTLTLTSALMAAETPIPQDPPQAGESAPSPDAHSVSRRLPFHGKLTAVDPKANTITLTYSTGDKVFHITPHTEILKHEKPAKLDEAQLGEQVSGAFVRNGDRAELTKLNLVKKSDDKAEGPKKAAHASRKTMKDKAQ